MLETKWARDQQARNIERSRRLLSKAAPSPDEVLRLIRGGDNFTFICPGELADLKLWFRPAVSKAQAEREFLALTERS
jgi:hypothetical protein